LSRRQGMLAALVMAMGATGTHAAEASAEVDVEFLEFLGSLDTEEEEWRDYLAERPIRSEMGKPASRTAPEKKPAPEPDKVKKP
jgi:hypothetical protein